MYALVWAHRQLWCSRCTDPPASSTSQEQQQLVIEGQNMLKCSSAPVCNGCMNTIFGNCQLSFQNRNDQFVGCVIWSAPRPKVKVWVKTIVMHWTHHTHCKYWNIVHIQHYQWHQLQLKSTLSNQTFISFHFTPRLFSFQNHRWFDKMTAKPSPKQIEITRLAKLR